MEDARTSTSSQRLERTFETLLESPEPYITAIPVVRPESFPTGNSGDIPVSVQPLVYGGQTGGVETSSKSLDRDHELLYSSKEALAPRKDRSPSEGLEIHVSQRKSLKYKGLVEKQKHLFRGSEEIVGPKEAQQPSGSSPSLYKQECASTGAKQGKERPKEQ
ncbi:hypothetical protein O181_013759 [Austropuccinia psidii MF-1]|uniref:Uncharacterized protein n=1 Tax=Austropuccinia psidii MF-1 TaxID=1389203 RepID=A0A9Q3BX00_9BASI|nr:hypothetical protein [Austropuccinia psidii MF-1]